MDILVKNANVITPYEILEKHEVSIEDGKIKDIREKGDYNEAEYNCVIDASGNYLSPGFIDIHNHGNFGHDVMEASFEALDSMSKFHIKNGITGFLATTMTSSPEDIKRSIKNTVNYIEAKGRKYETKIINSQVLGLYLEGPYFSQEKKGAQPSEYITNPDIMEVKEFLNLSNNNIKICALAPELPRTLETISYLKSKGITISAGHTNASFKETKDGINTGITQATHLYNGMRTFSHREPGVIGAVLTDERVTCEMICDGIHLHPAAMKMAVKLKGKDGIILISDAMMATGLNDGEYELGGQRVFVKNSAARLSSGALAGSTLTLNRAVYNMVHMVKVSLQDAVRMASLNPAKAAGVADKKGSIEIGKDADLIIFNENIDIPTVIVGGRILNL